MGHSFFLCMTGVQSPRCTATHRRRIYCTGLRNINVGTYGKIEKNIDNLQKSQQFFVLSKHSKVFENVNPPAHSYSPS